MDNKRPANMKNLIYLLITIVIVACSSDDKTNTGDRADLGGEAVYLGVNGITIKAKNWAEAGDTGEIGGVTYTVVDETMLRDLVYYEEDVTRIATTRVTDMSSLFANAFEFN